MSKLKKLFLVLVACTILCTALLISSCGGDGENVDTSTNTQTDTSTNTNTNTGTGTNTNTSTDVESENGKTYYYVYFIDQNGMPIEGVNVQICKDGLCLRAQISDANGRTKFEYKEKTDFKIQINSVPEGCVYPGNDYISFPEGKTTAMVEITRLQKYTITASDMHGNRLPNILVELYNKATNELVDSFITEENGRAVFEVAPDEYYAIIKHANDNAAFVLTGSEGDNKIELTSKNVQVQFVVLDDNIDYTVTLGSEGNGAEVKLYNENFELIDTKTAGDDGVVVFNVPNGSYYAVSSLDGHYIKPVIFQKNGKVSESVDVLLGKGGSKENPIYLLGEFDITIAAGEELYVYIPNAQGKNIKIESETLKVRCLERGMNFTIANGIIDNDLMAGENGGSLLKITTNKAEGTDSIKGVIYEPGTEKTPYVLDISDAISNGMTVSVDENGRVYYSFVADKDGTITATTETEYAVISINGNPFKKSVKEGDTVLICFYTAQEVGDNIEHPAAEITASFTYALVQADYKVTTVRDSEISGGVTVELYEKIGDEYKKIETVVSGENGEIVFANMTEAANYYIKVVCDEKYETPVEYTPFGDENEITVYTNHVRDGSIEYPFLIASSESEETESVVVTLDGTTKWYTSFYVQGAQVSIDNGSATVKIYTATSGEDEPTLVATLTGDALLYTLASDLGTTARVLISVEGTEGNVTLSFVAPEIQE